jgi:hypothetical protein
MLLLGLLLLSSLSLSISVCQVKAQQVQREEDVRTVNFGLLYATAMIRLRFTPPTASYDVRVVEKTEAPLYLHRETKAPQELLATLSGSGVYFISFNLNYSEPTRVNAVLIIQPQSENMTYAVQVPLILYGRLIRIEGEATVMPTPHYPTPEEIWSYEEAQMKNQLEAEAMFREDWKSWSLYQTAFTMVLALLVAANLYVLHGVKRRLG